MSTTHRNGPSTLVLAAASALVLAVACNGGSAPRESSIPAAVLVIELPASFGEARRPPVPFDHGKHAQALEKEGCETCHERDRETKRLAFATASVDGAKDSGAWMGAYHDKCMGCHSERDQGALACGHCHTEASPATRHHVLRFDHTLHRRHEEASEGDCATCHHVFDAGADKLVFREGAQGTCRSCHEQPKRDGMPDLPSAAHDKCVNCHLERAADNKDTGPTQCIGCHDRATVEKLKPVDGLPRLHDQQRDTSWVHAEGGTVRAVAFDHRFHETQELPYESRSACRGAGLRRSR